MKLKGFDVELSDWHEGTATVYVQAGGYGGWWDIGWIIRADGNQYATDYGPPEDFRDAVTRILDAWRGQQMQLF